MSKMQNVTLLDIKNASKPVKSLFNRKKFLKKKRTFSLNEFDRLIKEAATILGESEHFSISFIIEWEDDEGATHENQFENVELSQIDCQSGVRGVIEADLVGDYNVSPDVYDLQDLIAEELISDDMDDGEIDKEDLIPESVSLGGNEEDSFKENNEEVEQENSTEDDSYNEGYDNPSQPSFDDLAQDTGSIFDQPINESIENSNEEYQDPYPEEDVGSILNVMSGVNPDSQNEDVGAIVPTASIEAAPTIETPIAKIQSISEYANPGQFDGFIDSIDTTVFSLDELKQRFGYVVDPEDEYQEELNKIIDEKISSFGLNEFANNFNLGIRQIVDEKAAQLGDSYREINDVSVFVESEQTVTEEIEELKDSVNEKIAENNSSLEDRVATKKESLDQSIEEKVAAYRTQLELDASEELETYESALKREVDETNKKLLEQRDKEADQIKADATNDIIEERNEKLLDTKQAVVSDFNKEINLSYLEYSDNFYEKSKKCLRLISEKKKEIEEKRLEDIRLKEQQEKEERRLAQKDRELDILEQQANQNPKLLAQQVMNEMSPLMAQQQIPAANYSPNPEMAELKQQIAELTQQLNESQHKREISDLEDKLENERKASRSALSKVKRAFFLSSAALLIAAFGIGGFMVTQHDKTKTVETAKSAVIQTKQSSSKEKSQSEISSSVKESSSTSASDSESSTPAANEAAAKEQNTSQSDVDKFVNATNDADKYNILNSALGQNDLALVGSINAVASTPIGSLYDSILRRNGEEIREKYKNLSVYDRGFLSDVAKNAITLNFYDVSEWQEGTDVRNGN